MRSTRGAPFRSTSVPKAPAAPRMICPKSASSASSFDSAWTNDGERKWSSEGTGGDWQPLCQSLAEAPRRQARWTYQHLGECASPPVGVVSGGLRSSPGRLRTRSSPRAGLSPTERGRRRALPGRERRGRGVNRVPADSPCRVRSMSRGRCRRRSRGASGRTSRSDVCSPGCPSAGQSLTNSPAAEEPPPHSK